MDFDKIKKLCLKKQITIPELSEKIGMSRAGLYTSIKNQTVTVTTLEKIATALDVSINVFFENENAGLNPALIEEIDKLADQNNELIDKLESRQAIINLVLYFVKQIISKYDRLKAIHGEPEFGPGDEEFETFINDTIESLNLILSSVKERKTLGLDLGQSSIGKSIINTDSSGKTSISEAGAIIAKQHGKQSPEIDNISEKSFFKQSEAIVINVPIKSSKTKA